MTLYEYGPESWAGTCNDCLGVVTWWGRCCCVRVAKLPVPSTPTVADWARTWAAAAGLLASIPRDQVQPIPAYLDRRLAILRDVTWAGPRLL